MSLMAVCPSCGVENSPMNTACDICKAPLGVALVENAAPGLGPLAWMWIAMAITIVAELGVWTFRLPLIAMALMIFYGPLIAAWRARTPAMVHAALGGILALLALIVLALVFEGAVAREVLTSAMGGTPEVTEFDVTTGTSLLSAFVFGSLVIIVELAPIALVGASVGEHLAARRRARVAPKMPTARLSDKELAGVEL